MIVNSIQKQIVKKPQKIIPAFAPTFTCFICIPIPFTYLAGPKKLFYIKVGTRLFIYYLHFVGSWFVAHLSLLFLLTLNRIFRLCTEQIVSIKSKANLPLYCSTMSMHPGNQVVYLYFSKGLKLKLSKRIVCIYSYTSDQWRKIFTFSSTLGRGQSPADAQSYI